MATRNEYIYEQGEAARHRRAIRAAMNRAADPVERQELEATLQKLGELPPLPPATVFELYEPDGTYMGATRSEEFVEELRQQGLKFEVREAADIYHRSLPLTPEYETILRNWRRARAG